MTSFAFRAIETSFVKEIFGYLLGDGGCAYRTPVSMDTTDVSYHCANDPRNVYSPMRIKGFVFRR